jgi:hypothetical protein
MSPHFHANRRMFGVLDSDLVGLPPAFAARVFLHRRGWTTHQASIGSGQTFVAIAERGTERIRCEADESASAWWQVLRTAEPEHARRITR